MLPIFPNFKKLDFSDRQNVESFFRNHSPHSDYNFHSLWSWDVKSSIEICELNKNLVVKFHDYISEEPFYSFLGKNEVNKTIRELLEFSISKNMPNELRLIHEECISDLDSEKYKAEIDRNNFDYIYNVKDLSTYAGRKFSDKRTMINRFIKHYGKPEVKILDIKCEPEKAKVINLNTSWLTNKTKSTEGYDIKNEFIAIEKFLNSKFEDVLCIGLFLNNELLGYSIFNILQNNYAMAHFSKANTSFVGTYEYLMRECATILLRNNCSFLNYQQDLGIQGLAQSKSSFRPIKFIKKFKLKLK